MIESRTSRASAGMQTPAGQLQSTLVNTEAARPRFPSWLNTGASPRATGGCILPRQTLDTHMQSCIAPCRHGIPQTIPNVDARQRSSAHTNESLLAVDFS